MTLPEIDPSVHEQNHVHDVYNQIAVHFSQTRYKPWPIVEEFLTKRPAGSVGLDVGCGNGKYCGLNPNVMILGSDRSTGLIDQAWSLNRKAHNDMLIADGLALPHPNGRFDFAISIAVIHHFSTNERRIAAIQTILEKLRSGGQVLVYCWALEQATSRRGYKEGDPQDVFVPWVLPQKKDQPAGETKMRYYHLYKEGELVQNGEAAGGVVVSHGYEKDNWWVILQKP